jgi:chromosome segregation ATPase
MTLECYKDKNKRDVYYYEGKRISKKQASVLGNLPKCVSKTSGNEIKGLKKRIKELMSGRGECSNKVNELSDKIKECVIVKEKYNEIISLLESAGESVDLLNRVCLTQDVKKKMDVEYRKMEDIIEEDKKTITVLNEEIITQKEVVGDLNRYVVEFEKSNLALQDMIKEEKDGKRFVEKELEYVKEECSDKPVLVKTIEELQRRLSELQAVSNEMREEIRVNKGINEDMRRAIEDLEKINSLLQKDYAREIEEGNSLKGMINQYKLSIERYEAEVGSLNTENDMLRKSNTNLQTVISELRVKTEEDEFNLRELMKIKEDMVDKDREISDMRKVIKEYIDRYENDIRETEDEIERLMLENNELKEELSNIKGDCSTTINKLEEREDILNSEISRLKGDIIRQAEACNTTITKLEEREDGLSEEINTMKGLVSELERKLSIEKENCLYEVQRAIDNEQTISKKEAKEYQDRIYELNKNLELAREMKEELMNAPIEMAGQVAAVKSVKKKAKKLKGGPARQVMG